MQVSFLQLVHTQGSSLMMGSMCYCVLMLRHALRTCSVGADGHQEDEDAGAHAAVGAERAGEAAPAATAG